MVLQVGNRLLASDLLVLLPGHKVRDKSKQVHKDQMLPQAVQL